MDFARDMWDIVRSHADEGLLSFIHVDPDTRDQTVFYTRENLE